MQTSVVEMDISDAVVLNTKEVLVGSEAYDCLIGPCFRVPNMVRIPGCKQRAYLRGTQFSLIQIPDSVLL